MYPNLDKELSANKMSQRSAAKAIGMSESTFRDKFSKGNFSIHEAFMIHRLLLPKFELEYLFESPTEKM